MPDGVHLINLQTTNRAADTLEWAMETIGKYLYFTSVIGIDSGGGGEEMVSRLRDTLRHLPDGQSAAPGASILWAVPPWKTTVYSNKRGEMYFGLQYRMRTGKFHADLPDKVRQQLIEQTYEYDSEGRQRVLPKHLQKERVCKAPMLWKPFVWPSHHWSGGGYNGGRRRPGSASQAKMVSSGRA